MSITSEPVTTAGNGAVIEPAPSTASPITTTAGAAGASTSTAGAVIPTITAAPIAPAAPPIAARVEAPAAPNPASVRGARRWRAPWATGGGAWRSVGLGMLSGLLVFTIVMGLYAAFNSAPSVTARTGGSAASSSGSTNSSGSTGSTAQIAVPPHQVYNAQPPAASTAASVNLTLTVKETLISVAPNIAYRAWTFDGTVPGPILRVRQGQTVNFTLVNNGTMGHSIDFHAAQVPPNIDYKPIPAGGSISFSFTPQYPGVFMYHCGMAPVMDHIANGMYGAIIVDPANGWAPAQEYALVQSEFYTQKNADGSYSLNEQAMMSMQPTYVVFNGYEAQYVTAPLTAKAGEKIRLFIVNAGPTEFSAFHVIGAIFSDYYPDGNPANRLQGDQTITIPPGGGAVVEMTMPEAGKYTFVTHSFAAAMTGAIGAIKVS